MVPHCVFRQPLGFLFREDLCMSLVLIGDVRLFFCCGLTNSNFADEILILRDRTWFVDRAWSKSGFFCVRGSKYDG